MSMSDPLGDMLTRIRNGIHAFENNRMFHAGLQAA
jgi:ribosomal protein S8